MSKIINIIGKKFNRLTVISFSHKNKSRQYFYNCKCDCGNKCIVNGNKIRSGHTKSCGCLKIENGVKQIEKNRTINIIHGDSKTMFYKVWNTMKERCLNYNNRSWKNYGERGITVSNRWLKYLNFKEDMYESYEKHVNEYGENQTTLERINNNGNYCKENCCWATRKEQNNNTRKNILIRHNEKIKTVSQLSIELGINIFTIYSKIKRYKKNSSFKIGNDRIIEFLNLIGDNNEEK